MNTRRTVPCALLMLAVASGLAASPRAAAAHGEYDLKAQLELLLKWWPGEYDNHEQIVRQSGGGLSPLTDQPFQRVHSRYELVSGSPLGEHVISVVEHLDDDPTRLRRARTYVVRIDPAAGALRLIQYAARSPASTASAASAASPASTAAPELAPLGPGCDLLLQFVGGQFEGGQAPRSCKAAGEPAEYGLVVGPRYTWFREQPGHAWFEQTRARRFTCMVQENAEGRMRETRFLKTIRLHDQGGQADIAWPDGRTLTFTIHSRAFTSPPEREYPLFRIHEKGQDVPIAYAYAVDDAARFGLNLGWFYVRCYAEGQDLGADAAYAR